MIGANMSLTKDMWNKIKNKVCLDDRKVSEDVDISIHINEAGGKIGFDNSMTVLYSARRMLNNPYSFFVQYPLMQLKTRSKHLTSRAS